MNLSKTKIMIINGKRGQKQYLFFSFEIRKEFPLKLSRNTWVSYIPTMVIGVQVLSLQWWLTVWSWSYVYRQGQFHWVKMDLMIEIYRKGAQSVNILCSKVTYIVQSVNIPCSEYFVYSIEPVASKAIYCVHGYLEMYTLNQSLSSSRCHQTNGIWAPNLVSIFLTWVTRNPLPQSP